MISLKLYFININIKRSISVTNLNGKMSNAHYQILTKHFIESFQDYFVDEIWGIHH
ncbi:hypothetical protein H8356DRAFT_1340958 [Neocallimastix lanati (nom. inval.)]|nr:hypothetical protein H8356DRAFT_1340958 [Neocallimastix sp. JGI-2020a]